MMHIRRKSSNAEQRQTIGYAPLWHAIETETGEEPGARKALCGFKPSAPWHGEAGETVTCPRCLDRLSRPGPSAGEPLPPADR